MIGFGLKLWGFLSGNWKWIAPLLAFIGIATAGYLWISDKIADAREQGITQGVSEEKKRWEARINEENERNRKFEELLDKAIENFGRDVVEQTVERMAKETKAVNKIETIIRENRVYQDCKVDQEVLDARNEIRRLGPQQYPIRIPLEN